MGQMQQPYAEQSDATNALVSKFSLLSLTNISLNKHPSLTEIMLKKHLFKTLVCLWHLALYVAWSFLKLKYMIFVPFALCTDTVQGVWFQ